MTLASGCTNVYPEWELWVTLGIFGFLIFMAGMSYQGYRHAKGKD